jgi:hypothetical protein
MSIFSVLFINNNRKCDIDEFKCVDWIKSALSGSWYCMDISICCSCYTDIVVFLIGTNYNPQQSSYHVLNWTFSPLTCRLVTVIKKTSQDCRVGTRHTTRIVSPLFDRHPILISVLQNKPIIWVRTWISWVKKKIMFGCARYSMCLILDTGGGWTRHGSHFIYTIIYFFVIYKFFLSLYTNWWILVQNVIAES